MKQMKLPSLQLRKRLFVMYLIFLTLLSLGIALMPYTVHLSLLSIILLYVSAIMFWLGLCGVVFMMMLITHCRKSCDFKINNGEKRGFLKFFKIREAFRVDVVLVLGLVAFIVSLIIGAYNSITFTLLSISIFSFGMHIMLSGKNYIFLKSNFRRKKK